MREANVHARVGRVLFCFESTASSSHLRTMLPESSSRPLPAEAAQSRNLVLISLEIPVYLSRGGAVQGALQGALQGAGVDGEKVLCCWESGCSLSYGIILF